MQKLPTRLARGEEGYANHNYGLSSRRFCNKLSGSTFVRTLMRRTALIIATIAFSSVYLTTTAAEPIPGLFNTGVLNDNSLANGGSVDLHYVLTESADPSSTTFVTSAIPPPDYWIANGPISQWIAPDPNQDFSGLGDSDGNYIYRLTFDLTGFDPNTASISGQWAVDNTGEDILINGVSTGNYVNSSLPIGFSPFTINEGFVEGLNTLDFLVFNIPEPTGTNPTGLRVEFLSSEASPIPWSTAPPTEASTVYGKKTAYESSILNLLSILIVPVGAVVLLTILRKKR